MQKLLTFYSKNISIYVIFCDQNFNDRLTNDIVGFEQLGPRHTNGDPYFFTRICKLVKICFNLCPADPGYALHLQTM